jgi:hypothetical protein
MKVGWILLGAGLVGTGIYLSRLNKVATELQTVVFGRIHKIGVAGVTIAVDTVLKNPTKGSLKIKFPFVKLVHNGKTIGSSQSVNTNVDIPAFGESHVDGIMIDLTWTSLLLNAMDMYKAFKDSKPIVVQAKIMTNTITAFGTHPYESTENMTLSA